MRGNGRSVRTAGARRSVESHRVHEQKRAGVTQRPDGPPLEAQITAKFEREYFICGVAPYEEHYCTLEYRVADTPGTLRGARGRCSAARCAMRLPSHTFSRPDALIPWTPIRNTAPLRSRAVAHLRRSALLLCVCVCVTPPVADRATCAGQAEYPEVCIVSAKNGMICADALRVLEYARHQATDYQLVCMPGELQFYVVSLKEIVKATPRTADDHINWLLERNRFEEALQFAEAHANQLAQNSVPSVGQRYMAHLMAAGDFAAAAALSRQVLGVNATLWETTIVEFINRNQLQAISQFIPTSNPRLSQRVYEAILLAFLRSDRSAFLQTLRTWPPDLYDVNAVIPVVEQYVTKTSGATDALLEALAILYERARLYDRALNVYMSLRHGDVFPFIVRHDLFDAVRNRINALLEFNERDAIAMLVNEVGRIPPADVVAQLKDHPQLLHKYLDALFQKDPQAGAAFHELQVALYAQFDYAKLMPFLRQSSRYPLEKALAECRRRDLIPETVYLLGRLGNAKEALQLIIDRLGDVNFAIEFVKENNDQHLWNDLIEYSMKKPGTFRCPVCGLVARLPRCSCGRSQSSFAVSCKMPAPMWIRYR